MIAVIVLSALALVFGILLGFAADFFKIDEDPVAERVNDLLPQTQCGQCGYAGCKPYAEAIVNDSEKINLCPPGGQTVITALSELLDVEAVALDGAEKLPSVAVIDEENCIGCTLCIQSCPVDAIVGASKLMHTVIADECTGCELCLPPCPVDCIDMAPIKTSVSNWIPELRASI